RVDRRTCPTLLVLVFCLGAPALRAGRCRADLGMGGRRIACGPRGAALEPDVPAHGMLLGAAAAVAALERGLRSEAHGLFLPDLVHVDERFVGALGGGLTLQRFRLFGRAADALERLENRRVAALALTQPRA